MTRNTYVIDMAKWPIGGSNYEVDFDLDDGSIVTFILGPEEKVALCKYDSFVVGNDEFIGKHPEYPKLTYHQSEVLSKYSGQTIPQEIVDQLGLGD